MARGSILASLEGFFEAQLYNAMQEPALKLVLARFVAEHGAELGLGGSRPDRK